MSVRKQCNRYKIEPFGRDFNDVVERAKSFFKGGSFYVSEYGGVYSSFRPSLWAKDPDNSIYFDKVGNRWIRRLNV